MSLTRHTKLRRGTKPLQQRSRLKPGPPLRRKTRLALIGKKAAALYESQFCGWHSERLRRRPCDGLPGGSHATGCRIWPELNYLRGDGKNDPSHVYKRRGKAGGLFFHIVTMSRECHDFFELMPPAERERMLPLAYSLAWESHHLNRDLVPAPPVPESLEEESL